MTLRYIIQYTRQYGIRRLSERLFALLGYLILPLSYIFARNKKKWVLGNKTGFGDNSKYLYLYLCEHHSEIRAIWIAHSNKELADAHTCGYEAYMRWSALGIWHCLTAGVYLYSSSISDVNYWTHGRALRVNLWHGVGIKKLGLKGTKSYNKSSLMDCIFTPYNYCTPNLFVTTSPLMTDHFRECYALSEEQVCESGYPRCDYLQYDRDTQLRYLQQYESSEVSGFCEALRTHKHVIVYMPTFRESASDLIAAAGINLEELDSLMREIDGVFLLKLHPATKLHGDYSRFTNIRLMDKNMDIYPILPETDMLITDYSSIYYDYLLMENKHILLYPFDYESYIANSRDLAYDYNTHTPGPRATNWEELKTLINHSYNSTADFEKRKWILRLFWGENEGKATEQIIQRIKQSIQI